MRLLTAALALLGSTALAHANCGEEAGPCEIDNGTYHIALPDKVTADTGMVMYLHGYGSSGEGSMKNTGMVNALLARGYAVVAPDGEIRSDGRKMRFWNFLHNSDTRDDTAFLRAVADDAAKRFGLDKDKVLLSGFSMGAFEVAYLACEAPETFSAYATISGGFWRPQPESCAGPVRLFHTHGWKDNTVPLEGRELGRGAVQGDIFAGLELWRETNQCTQHNPDEFSTNGEFQRRRWTKCAEGSALEFALHPGGHMIPRGWSDMVLDWFEGKDPAS